MSEVHFTNLLIVVAIALLAPLALGFFPRIRLPAIVLEIVLGIVVGPSGLGWVKPDLPVSILALIGLAFLLFLSGLEIDVERLRGRILKLTGAAFALSFGIAIIVGLGLKAGGFVKSPLFVAIVLVATSLGVIVPVFFVTSGLRFDLNALFSSASTVARVPLFLVALLLVRGLPAIAYTRLLGRPRAVIAGVLQATSLPFIVAATQIGVQIGVVTKASAAGLVAAGLLSVIIFPALGLVLLRRGQPATAQQREASPRV